MVAYRDSVSERKREPAWMRAYDPSVDFCWRTKPRPSLLASVQIRVGLKASKKDRTGATVRVCFAVVNAWSCWLFQTKSLLVLRRGRNGTRAAATDSVLAESWLASPKNERRSVRLLGVGN